MHFKAFWGNLKNKLTSGNEEKPLKQYLHRNKEINLIPRRLTGVQMEILR